MTSGWRGHRLIFIPGLLLPPVGDFRNWRWTKLVFLLLLLSSSHLILRNQIKTSRKVTLLKVPNEDFGSTNEVFHYRINMTSVCVSFLSIWFTGVLCVFKELTGRLYVFQRAFRGAEFKPLSHKEKSQTCWFTLSVFFHVIMRRLNRGCGGVEAPGSQRGHAPRRGAVHIPIGSPDYSQAAASMTTAPV